MYFLNFNKNISKVKETQGNKLCNLLPKNTSKNSNTCQDIDKVVFNLSGYNLYDHEKPVLCKGFHFAIPPKGTKTYLFKGQTKVIILLSLTKVTLFVSKLSKILEDKVLHH